MSDLIEEMLEDTDGKSVPVAPPAYRRALAAAGAIGMGAGAGLVYYFDPAESSLFPACLLFSLTGYACPGCGLTRGFHELFHGRIIPALDFNILIPLWVLVFGWAFLSLVLFAARGRGLSSPVSLIKLPWILLVVLGVFGVLRNVPVWPLTILFP